MKRPFRNAIFYLLILLVIIGIVCIFNNNNETTEKMTQDEFYTHLESGHITSLTMQPESSEFKLAGNLKGYDGNMNFVTYIPFSEYSQSRINDAVDKLDKDIIIVEPLEKTSGWVTFFTSIIPFVIILILFFFIFLLVAVRKKWNG
ncbi:ATP-dependent metallopeptidase FtsH/Yme1/Tma family protein [Peribacillus butanolivorans]|uniref:ATP-dependent metallopeptidase FtsH/Yme1/Tma family protein n=1 Tax=Peribacillus butanolivorans TaxID=421767 RepID=UPI002E1A6933|nr:ATP-dependent metallopeptidase FtsH/Yme1/Tma family protein [Peribacillus butanolivorans]MED3691226.1 ATP-dependent metallopeptidase FtsH/Yme1/Tma family protein [Peribacillus butanolivorans]